MTCWLVFPALRACPRAWLRQWDVGWGPEVLLVQVLPGCTCLLQLSPGVFPFPALAGSVPAGQEFLLSFLPWLWLTEAVDSRCSSVQQCWKAALAWTPQLAAVPANGHSSGWMLWIREAPAFCSSCWQRVQHVTTQEAPATFSCYFLKLWLCLAAPAPAQLWRGMLLLLSSGDFNSSYWTLQLLIALACFQLKVIPGQACWNSCFCAAVLASYSSSC